MLPSICAKTFTRLIYKVPFFAHRRVAVAPEVERVSYISEVSCSISFSVHLEVPEILNPEFPSVRWNMNVQINIRQK